MPSFNHSSWPPPAIGEWSHRNLTKEGKQPLRYSGRCISVVVTQMYHFLMSMFRPPGGWSFCVYIHVTLRLRVASYGSSSLFEHTVLLRQKAQNTKKAAALNLFDSLYHNRPARDAPHSRHPLSIFFIFSTTDLASFNGSAHAATRAQAHMRPQDSACTHG